MLRTLMLAASLTVLCACQPATPITAAPKPDVPSAPAAQSRLELVIGENTADLYDWTGGNERFSILCTLDQPRIIVMADRGQFAKEMTAQKAALVVSGESFSDDLWLDSEDDTDVTLPLVITPALLKALAGATTARLMVDEPNVSFAETAVDRSGAFAKFAVKCGTLSKVEMAP